MHFSEQEPVRSGSVSASALRQMAEQAALASTLTLGDAYTLSTTAGQVLVQPPAAAAAGGRTTAGCGGDIVRVLREAGHRLTEPQIEDAFGRLRIEWFDRTVKRHLAELQNDGFLDNDPNADPPGYGLRG
jgi:hypothetical protein